MAAHRALLPSGFYDMLAPDAAFEAELQANIMECFQSYGYQRIKPPLVEFEDNILRGSGDDLERQTFRVMDPLSQRMMGLRADITMQIGRIALTRLHDAPKPLRLCYSGTVLNTKSSTLSPDRQHVQAGIEIIGVDNVLADAEAIILGARALKAVGVANISVDLNLPTLVPSLLEYLSVPPARVSEVILALAHKNISALNALDDNAQTLLAPLGKMFGPADTVLALLKAAKLPEIVQPLCLRLESLVKLLHTQIADVAINIDVTESRGFDYHNGVSFAFYAAGIDTEIGRGGRYTIAFDEATPAMGVTLYVSRLVAALPTPDAKPLLWVPSDTSESELHKLHSDGWATVLDMSSTTADKEHYKNAAKDCGCSHFWYKNAVIEL